MLRLTRPSVEHLTHWLAEAKQADLSYPEAGATRDATLPAGYRLDRYEHRLGSDGPVLGRAAEALRAWRLIAARASRSSPATPMSRSGQTVLFLAKTAGFWAAAPCRVVYVVDEPNRSGFAYGTLPGHPEQGEAAMILERDELGDVVFRIVSFSRTVDPLARLGSPVTRRVQRRVTNRYLHALEREAADRESASRGASTGRGGEATQ